MYVVGLMSGTSGDGVDGGLVEIKDNKDGIDMNLLEFITLPYSDKLKSELNKILPPNSGSVDELTYMHYYLGRKFGEAALKLIEKSNLEESNVGLIASHGHTIRNLPPKNPFFNGRCRKQIGELAIIAEMTGITTIGDFRPAEVAAGGEGAPLIPYFDYHLLRSSSRDRVILNLGGIANITYIPSGASLDDLVAFDVGPGNMIIDQVVSKVTDGEQGFDEDGEFAARGETDKKLLDELMRHPFINKEPPKSAGHEDFGSDYVDRIITLAKKMNISKEDLISTVTEFTTEAVAFNLDKYLGYINEIIVSGGGVHNDTLMKTLNTKLDSCEVSTTEEYGVPIDAKEAMGFALLGYQGLHKIPNNVPSSTGAEHPTVIGKIVWGRKDFKSKENRFV